MRFEISGRILGTSFKPTSRIGSYFQGYILGRGLPFMGYRTYSILVRPFGIGPFFTNGGVYLNYPPFGFWIPPLGGTPL